MYKAAGISSETDGDEKQIMKSKNIQQSQFLVLTAYILYLVIYTIDMSQYARIDSWDAIKTFSGILILAIALFGIAIKSKFKPKTLIVTSIVLAVGVFAGMHSLRTANLLSVVVFIFAGSFLESDKYFKVYFWTCTICVVGIILLSFIAPPENIISFRGTRSGRMYLGFEWVSYASNYLFHIVVAYFSQRKKVINIRNTVLFVSLNIILFKYTDTKAVFYELILYLLMLWILKLREEFWELRIFSLASYITFPLFSIISIVPTFLYTPANPIMLAADKLLTGRLSVGRMVLNQYSVKLWGNVMSYEGTGLEHNADSSYVNVLIEYGWVVFILLIIGFTILHVRNYKNHQFFLYVGLLIIAIHSITDPQLFSLRFNPYIIMIGSVLADRKKLYFPEIRRKRKKKKRIITLSK